jgi:peptidoglycan hydrolase FlgJ
MNNKITQQFNRFAYDLSGLNQLKRNAITGSTESIKQVAKQFESIFINMMMQNMRKAVPEGGLFSPSTTQLFTTMFDQQISQQAAGKGLGLAEIITKQLISKTSPSVNVNTHNNLQANSSNNQTNLHLAKSLFSDTSSTNLSPQALGQMIYHSLNTKTQSSTNNIHEKESLNYIAEDYVIQFVQEWLEPAKQASKSSGIPYEVIIAQAALETGWGQKQIKTADNQSSYNYFGIKATSSWNGNSTRLTTHEFVNNTMTKIKDNFKIYENKKQALIDYVNLLTKNPRYRAVATAPDARTAAKALQEAQYATDPNYSDKLIQIINRIEQIAKAKPITTIAGFKQLAFNK